MQFFSPPNRLFKCSVGTNFCSIAGNSEGEATLSSDDRPHSKKTPTERFFTEPERQEKCRAIYLALGLGQKSELLGNDTHPYMHADKYAHPEHVHTKVLLDAAVFACCLEKVFAIHE